MATTGKTTPKTTTATKKADASYSEKATALAADTRALADSVREDLAKLIDQIGALNETEPTADEARVADGVRRIPMGVNEVTRAVAALDHAAADLARTIG